MDTLQAQIAKTQQQLSTQQRIQSAADDPTGWAQVNQMTVEISASTQYVTNGNTAKANLEMEEQALSDASNIMQNANGLAVEANNSALTDAQRQNIATNLQSDLQSLVAIANRTDSNGNYLFGGYANSSPPFALSGTTASYSGSASVSQIQISANQSISAGDSGITAFMGIPTGNGTFTTAAGAANTGTASIDSGKITSASAWVPGTYTISFTDATNYQITDTTGTVVSSGTLDGADSNTIAFNGAQVMLNGAPAAGDTFTVSPSSTTSAFSVLSNLITTLNTPNQNTGQLATQIGAAVTQINNAITNFSNVSASVGSRINAISASQTTAQANQTSLTTNIQAIAGTDMAAATSQLSQQLLSLQAAQQSYASISNLSLFQYLK